MAFSALFRNSSLTQVSRNTIKLMTASSAPRPSLVRLAQTCACTPSKPTLLQHSAGRNVNFMPVRQSSDHRLIWKLEKLVSVSLLGVIPLTFLVPCWPMNDLFAIAVVLHQHWGLEAIVVDYIRPIIFGSVVPKLTVMALYVLSIVTLGGLLYFNHTDIGIAKFVSNIWTKSRSRKEVQSGGEE